MRKKLKLCVKRLREGRETQQKLEARLAQFEAKAAAAEAKAAAAEAKAQASAEETAAAKAAAVEASAAAEKAIAAAAASTAQAASVTEPDADSPDAATDTADVAAAPATSATHPDPLAVAELQQSLSKAELERDGLRAELSKLQTAKHELQASLARREAQLESLAQASASAHEAAQAQDSEIDALRAEVNAKTAALSGAAALEATVGEKDAALADMRAQVAAAEAKVKAVMEEGMGWSKEQAKQSRIIKKLREKLVQATDAETRVDATAKSLETRVQKLQGKLEESTAELADLKAQLTTSKAAAKEATGRCSAAEKKAARLENSLARETKLASERADRIAKLQSVDIEAAAHRAAAQERGAESVALAIDLQGAREALVQAREDAAETEERLQRELKSLHKKWQTSETRNEELADQVASSTRPLLRQVAALQSLLEDQRGVWQTSEGALTQRAVRAETAAARSAERQRIAVEELQTARLTLVTQEEKAKRLQEHLDEERRLRMELAAQVSALEGEVAAEKTAGGEARLRAEEHEALAVRMTATTAELESRLKALREDTETQAQEVEKEHHAHVTKLKTQLQRAELRCAEFLKQAQQGGGSSAGGAGDGGTDRKGGRGKEDWGGGVDDSGSGTGGGGGTSRSNGNVGETGSASTAEAILSEATWGAGASFLGAGNISQFHGSRVAQTQQRFLQTRCQEAEAARDRLAAKLVDMGSQLSSLQRAHTGMDALREEHSTLLTKQEVLLQLLGEKTEQVDGLESDIAEMKRMYRQQTETLLEQLAAATVVTAGQ